MKFAWALNGLEAWIGSLYLEAICWINWRGEVGNRFHKRGDELGWVKRCFWMKRSEKLVLHRSWISFSFIHTFLESLF